MATQSENKKQNLVLGRVNDKLNRPLANLVGVTSGGIRDRAKKCHQGNLTEATFNL